MASMTLRVRPGFTYGAHKQFKGGDLFAVDAEQATQLLAAFGDKLERVGDEPEVEVETPGLGGEPEPAVQPEKPTRRKRRDEREAGDS